MSATLLVVAYQDSSNVVATWHAPWVYMYKINEIACVYAVRFILFYNELPHYYLFNEYKKVMKYIVGDKTIIIYM